MGQSKLDEKNALRWYGQAYGIRWMALRYFNAAGADRAGKPARITTLRPDSCRAILAALDRGPALQVSATMHARLTARRSATMCVSISRARTCARSRARAGRGVAVPQPGDGPGLQRARSAADRRVGYREARAVSASTAGRAIPRKWWPTRSVRQRCSTEDKRKQHRDRRDRCALARLELGARRARRENLHRDPPPQAHLAYRGPVHSRRSGSGSGKCSGASRRFSERKSPLRMVLVARGFGSDVVSRYSILLSAKRWSARKMS